MKKVYLKTNIYLCDRNGSVNNDVFIPMFVDDNINLNDVVHVYLGSGNVSGKLVLDIDSDNNEFDDKENRII